MPRCLLTRALVRSLHRPAKPVHYHDEEIPGFLLEYRSSGGGTWYFRYRDADGKTRFLRLGTLRDLDPLEARARAYELYKAARAGEDPRAACGLAYGTPTLTMFVADRYLPHARLNKRSWDTDRRILRLHVLPCFGERRMDRIRRSEIVAWRNAMRGRGFSPGTCNRVAALLKFVFNCAVRWGMLTADKNPCRGLDTLAEPGGRERYLSAAEARRLLDELDRYPSRHSALAIKLLLFTGARKREILSARWEHVDWDRRLLTVPLAKSGQARHIPLSDEALAVLRRLPRREGAPWLFPGVRADGPLRSVFHTWNTIRTRLGLGDVRLHDLRHSFASFLVNSGCSLYEVQKILGHHDPRVTMRYAHLAPESLIRAANMVGQRVDEKSRRNTELGRKAQQGKKERWQ